MLRAPSLAIAVLLCACSSDSGDGGGEGGGGSSLAAFSAYCTGSLLAEMPIQQSSGPGSWSGTGETTPLGTTILVGASFDKWDGYLIQNGAVSKVDADFTTGLVKDTEFSSSCATDADAASFQHFVLLKGGTVYDNADLTGEPCKLAAGTELTNSSSSSGFGSSAATISADEIQEQCGIDQGYTDDLAYGYLVAK